MENNNSKEICALEASATISISNGKEITISVEEYTRLKDIETRFAILREETLHANYIPIHHQIILGIENEIKQAQELKTDLMP